MWGTWDGSLPGDDSFRGSDTAGKSGDRRRVTGKDCRNNGWSVFPCYRQYKVVVHIQPDQPHGKSRTMVDSFPVYRNCLWIMPWLPCWQWLWNFATLGCFKKNTVTRYDTIGSGTLFMDYCNHSAVVAALRSVQTSQQKKIVETFWDPQLVKSLTPGSIFQKRVAQDQYFLSGSFSFCPGIVPAPNSARVKRNETDRSGNHDCFGCVQFHAGSGLHSKSPGNG